MKTPLKRATIAVAGLLALGLGAGIGGCTSAPVAPNVVKVPVPVPCLRASEVPVAPALLTDAELKALDDYRLVLQLALDRGELRRYAGEAGALLKACAKEGK